MTALHSSGHDVVQIARSVGVDVTDPQRVVESLTDVEAVIDVSNTAEIEPEPAKNFFSTITANLLNAERDVGVRHHVALSIVGIDRGEGNGHYQAKRLQEQLVRDGPVPWTILRATQFFDFPAMVADWMTEDGVATLPPLLIQPVAPAEVGSRLAELAADTPLGRPTELAGPETHDFVDVARRTLEARGDSRRIRASWQGGPFGVEMAGEVLLPGPGAALGRTTLEEWLGSERHTRAEHR